MEPLNELRHAKSVAVVQRFAVHQPLIPYEHRPLAHRHPSLESVNPLSASPNVKTPRAFPPPHQPVPVPVHVVVGIHVSLPRAKRRLPAIKSRVSTVPPSSVLLSNRATTRCTCRPVTALTAFVSLKKISKIFERQFSRRYGVCTSDVLCPRVK